MKKSNNIYIYNGSFIHLLCLIKYLFKENIQPLDIKEDRSDFNLWDNIIKLEIKQEDNIVYNINKNLGSRIFNGLYYLYLSDKQNKEMLIYYFLLYSIKYKEKVFLLRKNDYIAEALKVIGYVGRESHKLKGFLRFRELQNKVLYAEFSPTCNVLPIMVKHFKNRLLKETWIIKDVKRNYLAYYDQKNIYFLDGENINISFLNNSMEEEKVSKMWKIFYDTVGISTRKNDRCRRNFMPKKYWHYITEVKDL